jgi:hypothetical protein
MKKFWSFKKEEIPKIMKFNIVYTPDIATFNFFKSSAKPKFKTTLRTYTEESAREYFKKYYPGAKLLHIIADFT